jgi:hypothetical protein
MTTIRFSELQSTDLQVDAIYQSGRKGNAGDDPFPRLLSLSNMGGFRYRGTLRKLELLVLTSTLDDPDWPDSLDRETGVFTYYGDNKSPGRPLHETPRHGNEILRRVFDYAHGDREARLNVPPIFIFANTGEWRDVIFLGVAVPGASDLRSSEDLVALWKLANGRRFQNYRARFTILDMPTVSRSWIREVICGEPHSVKAPDVWLAWIDAGRSRPLLANRSIEYRTKAEQLPKDALGISMIEAIHRFFAKRPHGFEQCAAVIVRFMLPDVASLDLTRPSRDGGRDAIGRLRIGKGSASILVDFALEAKCYTVSNPVGVREMSRLISRLRHRQFGVLVTTSSVDLQAYKEIKEDQHPIIVIAASDIVHLLRANGYSDAALVNAWLEREFST